MNLSSATRWGLNAAILLSIVLALYLGQAIFIPLVISLLLAAMLWPTATWMHQAGVPVPWLSPRRGIPWLRPTIARARVPWTMACLTVVTGFVLLVVLLIFAFGFGVSKLVIDLANDDKQREIYKDFRGKLERLSPSGIPDDDEYFPVDSYKSKVFDSVRGFFNPNSQPFLNLLARVANYGSNFIWQSILIMFILLFLLLEGKMLTRRFVEIFGPGAQVQGKAVEALKDMAYQIRAYLVWRTIINFAMGAFLGVVYQVLGLKLAWTWALLTAILWYIPYLGPIAAGVPPILDAFVSCNTPWIAVGILGFYTVFVILEGYVVVPVVMGRSMEMNATTVMLACLFWELVWGSPGLFLAMPLMAAVKAICHHVPDWRPWANLMSSQEELPEEREPLHAHSSSDGRDIDTRLATSPRDDEALTRE
jgi:predicted PurR-regulated permease PerM